MKINFEGYEYRGSLVSMSMHCHCVGVTQRVREAIGKKPGDKVKVKLYQDVEPRIIELPEDLKARLNKNHRAKDFYEGLSYSRQRKYVQWITSAKKAKQEING